MPSIDIHVLEGVFSVEGKADIIGKVTDAFGEIAGQTIRAGTSVRVQELSSGSWTKISLAYETFMSTKTP
jgi:4-oxalocrotonate tautomerase